CVVRFFFFQAEDGIRDFHVTGVQTCALPICATDAAANRKLMASDTLATMADQLYGYGKEAAGAPLDVQSQLTAILTGVPLDQVKIGRASCRESVMMLVSDRA